MNCTSSMRSSTLLVLVMLLALGKGQTMADETIQVTDVNGLYQAFDDARGHSGSLLEIVIADGDYKTDRSLELIGATQVRISAAKGATIVCDDGNAEVIVIAYCNNVQVSRLTLRHDPASVKTNENENLIRIDRSENIRFENCTLEFGPADSSQTESKTSPDVAKALGKEILAIVSDPDQILAFMVKPMSGKTVKKTLGKHEIHRSGGTLSDDQKQQLISLLQDDKTYLFGISKLGFQSPEYGFKFVKGDQEVGLLLDVHRHELVFLFNGKEQTENCDPVANVLAGLVAEIFPK